jgi:hypothetical protein
LVYYYSRKWSYSSLRLAGSGLTDLILDGGGLGWDVLIINKKKKESGCNLHEACHHHHSIRINLQGTHGSFFVLQWLAGLKLPTDAILEELGRHLSREPRKQAALGKSPNRTYQVILFKYVNMYSTTPSSTHEIRSAELIGTTVDHVRVKFQSIDPGFIMSFEWRKWGCCDILGTCSATPPRVLICSKPQGSCCCICTIFSWKMLDGETQQAMNRVEIYGSCSWAHTIDFITRESVMTVLGTSLQD